MKKIKYFCNFIRSYHKIFLKVLFFEIYYSIRFKEFLPKMKVQNNSKRTDTVPCVYYFLHELSKFLRNKRVKSIADIGSGYGRVVNFFSSINKIKTYGVEFDNEVYKKAIELKNPNVRLYCADIFKFDIKKLKSNCFILVDPFKRKKDRNKLLLKIEKIYPKKKKYIVAVNDNRGKFPKKFKLIHTIIGSSTRSLKVFET